MLRRALLYKWRFKHALRTYSGADARLPVAFSDRSYNCLTTRLPLREYLSANSLRTDVTHSDINPPTVWAG